MQVPDVPGSGRRLTAAVIKPVRRHDCGRQALRWGQSSLPFLFETTLANFHNLKRLR
ncbi:hypothetical protein SMG44B_10188 [Stenotrophomonas maltophilia]